MVFLLVIYWYSRRCCFHFKQLLYACLSLLPFGIHLSQFGYILKCCFRGLAAFWFQVFGVKANIKYAKLNCKFRKIYFKL